MAQKKNKVSKLSFIYSVSLFMIGMTLYCSKLDSKENHVKPIQYTGLICILSSSLSIFVGVMNWIRQSPFLNHEIIQANTTSDQGLVSSNSEIENKIDTLSLNNEDAITDNSNQLTRKVRSAPVRAEFLKKSDKKIFGHFDTDEIHISVQTRPSSSNN